MIESVRRLINDGRWKKNRKDEEEEDEEEDEEDEDDRCSCLLLVVELQLDKLPRSRWRGLWRPKKFHGRRRAS